MSSHSLLKLWALTTLVNSSTDTFKKLHQQLQRMLSHELNQHPEEPQAAVLSLQRAEPAEPYCPLEGKCLLADRQKMFVKETRGSYCCHAWKAGRA